jgi:EAL domain-containing protein (putative c-di-GMP-specific phosphodiesterase class I)
MTVTSFLNKYKISIYFQPIISTVNKKIIGYEALTRSFIDNEFISPLVIFEEAKEHNLSFEFDKYVRSLAVEKFTTYYLNDKNVLLFLNFESALSDENYEFKEFDFHAMCQQFLIPPSNVVIEIREDKIENSSKLEEFSLFYKNLGFNIALDDFGMGGSTFDRLSLVKPDIVKIDRSIISNIQDNFIHSEILKAITKMCNKIGAVVLAEGVEKKEEIIRCIKTDISIYQGFYFAKPDNHIEHHYNTIEKNILEISQLNEHMIKEHKSKKEKLLKNTQEYSNSIIEKLQQLSIINFSNKEFKDFMNKELKLEALYLINYHDATQVGETLLSGNVKKFYSPAKNGDSHYLKEYYYITKSSKEQSFLSQKYISNATGNMCRTFAKKFTYENNEYILCFDILV